jgi:hypothetical protein
MLRREDSRHNGDNPRLVRLTPALREIPLSARPRASSLWGRTPSSEKALTGCLSGRPNPGPPPYHGDQGVAASTHESTIFL